MIKTNNPAYLPGHEPTAQKKIFEFRLLWDGWELDNTGWIAEAEYGERYILLTDHGNEYAAQPQELRDKIKDYQRAIAQTRKALALLKGEK